MKEKIKKVINSKYFPLIFVILVNIILFIACNKLFTPTYEQVDDFLIMNLISKADGAYTIYGIQIHPIICGIIILLYKTGININWYTIFMLIMQFISFTIIGTVFIKKNKIVGIPLYITFAIMIYSKMLCNIQYTTVSMLCITAGTLLLMYYLEKIEEKNKFNLVVALLMIATGCMIRFMTVLVAIPFLGLYLICKFLKDKEMRILKIGLILAISILLIYASFNIFYNVNPIYKEFLKFHDARTYLHDYNILFYEENEEIFNNVNWSENDRDLFYGYMYGDEDVYTVEVLEEIKNQAIKYDKNINISQEFINTINEFLIFIRNNLYKYLFWSSVLLVVFNNIFIIIKNLKDKTEEKNDNIKLSFVNLVFLSIIFIHCLFIFLNRPMFRVVVSIYIIGLAILMYELIEQAKTKKKQIILCICIIPILIFSIFEFRENMNRGNRYNIENFSVYKEIIDYTDSHKENAYLYTLVLHDRFLAYSIYEKTPDNTFSNIQALGEWDTYTESYYNFKERYNIDNLIKSLYEKRTMFI